VTCVPFADYFRCPEHLAALVAGGPVQGEAGFFRFGDAVCYGRAVAAAPVESASEKMADVAPAACADGGRVLLPFDLAEVVTNLRHERYATFRTPAERVSGSAVAHAVYYFFRPALPVRVRKHLQRARLSGWGRLPFPSWPVDVTVETLMKRVVRLLLEASGRQDFPFIWFWPEGAPSCVMLTHDVEGPAGASLCAELMDLDAAFGLNSAFQVVPDAPWDATRTATRRLVEQLQCRGFEVNVHDLTHDGSLFRSRETFLEHAAAINARAREFGSRGFRSGAMYRRQDWFSAFEFDFDMSVPNVAHLEAQRGGCCTVMPYFLANVLELPLTTTQDYSLFHVLNDYSDTLWREQIELILENNGLASFIAHPDYLRETRGRAVYVMLLEYLQQLRDDGRVWVALPSEIDRWWRERRQMRLVQDGESWRIEGAGSARARIATARLDGDQVVYQVERGGQAA